MGLIPGSGRSPAEGNGNLLQYACLGNPNEGGALRATVLGGYKELGKTGAYAHTHTKKGLRTRALGLRQEGMLLFHRPSPSFTI